MSQEVPPRSTVLFKSDAKGTPPLSFKWFKDDKELNPDGTCCIVTEVSSSFVQLYSVKHSNTGYYTCHVTNDVGTDSCTAKLFVTGVEFFVVWVYIISVLFVICC